MKKRYLSVLFALPLVTAPLTMMVGCEDDNEFEEAGEEIDDAAEDTEDELEETGDDIEDSVD